MFEVLNISDVDGSVTDPFRTYLQISLGVLNPEKHFLMIKGMYLNKGRKSKN
jgi:hypothetical protein